jgi:hypothetical protein
VFLFSLFGDIGLSLALRRATRAGLLVIVATWLRSAAGSAGLREVSRRALRRLQRIPSMHEASGVLDELGSGRELGVAARTAVAELRGVPSRPRPLLDAVLRWVVTESARFRAAPATVPPILSLGVLDLALVALAAAPALVLISA